jgi:hypothetical protein
LLVDGTAVAGDLLPDFTGLIEFIAVNPQMPPYPGSQNGFFDLGRVPDRKADPANDDEAQNFR